MYEFVDRSVAQLTEGSRFILWAMRGWVQAAQRNFCPPCALEASFEKRGASEILRDFHMVMVHLHKDGNRKMAFGALYQSRITEIEAVLLAIWRDMVAGHHDRVRATLRLLLPEDNAEAVIASANRVVAHASTTGSAPAGLARPSGMSTPRS